MKTRRRRIRVLEPKPPEPGFARRLEERARRLKAPGRDDSAADLVRTTIAGQIALAFDQIKCVRKAHERARRSLLIQECYLDTEIMQREPRQPVYMDPRLPERDRLRDRLRAVEKERRQLLFTEAEQLRPLHDRLLSLLSRHGQFDTDHHGR